MAANVDSTTKTVSAVLSLVIVIMGFSWWCSSLDGQVGNNTANIKEGCYKMNSIEQTVNALNINQARQETRYVSIEKRLDRIINTLDGWEPDYGDSSKKK